MRTRFTLSSTFVIMVIATAAPLSAGLTVSKVDGPPKGPTVRIQQLERDETGPTSFRFYAPRSGSPTKTDEWVYLRRNGQMDETLAHYYFRDRDLGQTFTTDEVGFTLAAITVRLQPVDVRKADPAGAKVSVQLFKVTGVLTINDNGTNAHNAPNGTSSYADNAAQFGTKEPPFSEDDTQYTNAQWSTYATDWPFDPNDVNTPKRWPIMHYSDDFIEGEHYQHIALISGGVIPGGLSTNDYMRWEFSADSQLPLEPNTTYAFLFLFDEPAPEGVNRNIPLSNRNTVPYGTLQDPFPNGHAIRRDGSSTDIEKVFIYDQSDPQDVADSRDSASFPLEIESRLNIQPGTLGYPDVDTYRDLYFILESPEVIAK